MLAGGLIISRRFVQVITTAKHRSTHISNYQSSEHKSNQHGESDWMKFPCTLKNALLIIRYCFRPLLCLKRIGLPCCTFVTTIITCSLEKYLAIKLLCYLQFQHLQTLPCWKPLVISFCSSLGSTLLLIEKSYNWSSILMGRRGYFLALLPGSEAPLISGIW